VPKKSAADYVDQFDPLMRTILAVLSENAGRIAGDWTTAALSVRSNPDHALEKLIDDCEKYDFGAVCKEFVGDSHGIESLIGMYWGYADLEIPVEDAYCNGKRGAEAVVELKREIVAVAAKWQDRRASGDLR
jgi:hypothetical protein